MHTFKQFADTGQLKDQLKNTQEMVKGKGLIHSIDHSNYHYRALSNSTLGILLFYLCYVPERQHRFRTQIYAQLIARTLNILY